MNLKHLAALVGIADSGSFSKAADAMGTVQSNVSAHLARLEKELGATLVDRASCRLTEEGQIVVARARRVIAEVDALFADVGAMGHDIFGTIRLGTIGTTGRWLIPLLTEKIKARYPHVTLNVIDSTSATLEPLLASGQLDLAVVTLPAMGDELSASPLFEEDLVLVIPNSMGATVNEASSFPIQNLKDLDLLLPLPGTPLRDEIDSLVEPHQTRLKAKMELDGLWIIAALTFDGHGASILPATAIPKDMMSHCTVVPLEGSPQRRVGVALRTRGYPSAPTRLLIDLIYAVIRDVSTVPKGVHPTVVDPKANRPILGHLPPNN